MKRLTVIALALVMPACAHEIAADEWHTTYVTASGQFLEPQTDPALAGMVQGFVVLRALQPLAPEPTVVLPPPVAPPVYQPVYQPVRRSVTCTTMGAFTTCF